MNTIAPDQHITSVDVARCQHSAHAFAVLLDLLDPRTQPHCVRLCGTYGTLQHPVKIGAMQMVVGIPETLDTRVAKGTGDQCLSGLPMTHLAPYRPERDGIERLREAQGMQDTGAIRADLDPRANLAQPGRLLKNGHLKSRPNKREGERQATKPGTDYDNFPIGDCHVDKSGAVGLLHQRTERVSSAPNLNSPISERSRIWKPFSRA